MCTKYREEEHQLIVDVVQSLSENLPCEEGKFLLEALRARDFAGIVNRDYMDLNTDPNSFRDNYLFASLLRKYPHFPVSIDRKAVALKSFEEGETQCDETNYKFFSAGIDPAFSKVIAIHQNYMRDILGHLTRDKVAAIMAKAYWGPGANIGTKGNRTTLSDKIGSRLTCTKELAPFALSILNENPYISSAILQSEGLASLLDCSFEVVDGARLSFVPKSAKTDRSITVEPTLNSFVQNGIGEYLRQLLKRKAGIDLTCQERSIALAGKALKYRMDTIDLKNASNTLSIGLVKLSLQKCKDWFALLNLVRSQRYTLNGETRGFKLFAGMGNGFTFPLESLIFFSLARAACLASQVEPVVTVYGDDIILPSAGTEALRSLFTYVGLTVNVEKSFTGDSRFREACGGYFYDGHSVKPVFITKSLRYDTTLVSLHNALWRWAAQDGFSFDTRVVGAMRILGRILQSRGWSFVHPDLGDVGLWPLKSIGSNFLTYYKVRRVRTRSFEERGYRGHWVVMSRALSRVNGGSQPQTDNPARTTRRNLGEGCEVKPPKRYLYRSFYFPYIFV